VNSSGQRDRVGMRLRVRSETKESGKRLRVRSETKESGMRLHVRSETKESGMRLRVRSGNKENESPDGRREGAGAGKVVFRWHWRNGGKGGRPTTDNRHDEPNPLDYSVVN
jgi:hypothetical protein